MAVSLSGIKSKAFKEQSLENLQAQAATPQQFFNGFLNYPSETFEATNLQPFNYNQWLQNSSNYKSLSYV